MKNSTSSLSPKKLRHPHQTNSEVTIFDQTKSLTNIEQQDVETLIQSRYNEQQRRFLIVDRKRGKFIDTREVNAEKQMQVSLKQSYYVPSPTKKKSSDEQFIYQPVIDIQEDDTDGPDKVKLRKKQSQGSTKSVWESTWKQYDKIHQKFLQSILRNQTENFAKLLDKKASTFPFPIDINYRFQNNWAALHYAAMQPSPDFLGKLINQPQIDVNTLTSFNETALHIAVKSNNLQSCLMLIEAKISLDRTDNDINTALHYASQLGYRQIAKILLQSGASCLINNCMGMTAIDIAVPQLNDIFQPYKKGSEQENPLYRNRPNHRTMIQKMLQTKNCQQIVIPPAQQKRQKRDAQFWRKKNIFKLYNLMKQVKSNAVSLSQFEFYKKVGEGAFGQVHLVKREGYDQLYALKAIKKQRVNGTSLYRYIQTEREILSLVDHPFIVRLRFAFQTDEYLFLVMDYCEGGDLSKLLRKRRRFTQKQVKNYACELLLALQALHKYNIIYRDLKPENIVLDKDGHALITDFGLSKKIDNIESINRSFCGTPAYIPLEIINKRGHNRMVDWYEYGVVLYELYVGSPPYHADTKRQLYEIVKKGIVRFSKNTPPLLKDLIKRLLAQTPENRLGFEKDAESIRQHPWFADVNWEDVLERRLEMPKPECKLNIEDPICSKFIDIKGNKFNMPLWSFAQ